MSRTNSSFSGWRRASRSLGGDVRIAGQVEREDVVRAEVAEEQRDLVADVGQHRRDEHDGDDADDDAGDGEHRSGALGAQRVERQRGGFRDGLAPGSGVHRSRYSCLSALTTSSERRAAPGYQPATTPLRPAAARLPRGHRPLERRAARRSGRPRVASTAAASEQPGGAADEGDQQGLGQRLDEDVRAPGADRASHADLARALRHRHERRVGHDDDRGEQRHQRDRRARGADALGDALPRTMREASGVMMSKVSAAPGAEMPPRAHRDARVILRRRVVASPVGGCANTCRLAARRRCARTRRSGIQT